MAYLYNYCGKPEKAQGIIDYVCKQFYKDSPDGLIGNEDCGQMSAWYVMSSMGLYPVCPGSNVYATGIPQFYEVEIAREGKSGFLITRGEINRKEERAGPRMYPDEVTTAGATDGTFERSTSGVGAMLKPVALKKPWAAHQMERAKASELPALPTLKDLKGTPAARAAALKELQDQRELELRSMRKVYAAAELTVTHQQLMQSDGLVFSEVDSADRDKLILKTAKQTVPTSFVSVPVIEGSRTFKDSLVIRVSVPKGTKGILEIRVSNRERVALDKKGKPVKQAKGKGVGKSAILSALVVKPGTMETITAEADGAKPYEFVVAYDAVVSARLVNTEVYGGLPGSNPAGGKGDGLGSVTLGQSDWATGEFNKKENDFKVQLGEGLIPHPQYSAGGAGALVDEIQGSKEWRAGGWMGFYDQDFSAVIDLGSVQSVSEVNARFLQDSRAWILMPRTMQVWSSTDGVKYTEWPQAVAFKDDWLNNETLIDPVVIQHTDGKVGVKPIKARYIKIEAAKYGKLPEGHLGYPYNGSGYIFMDEIGVR
jgi:hypothetical protein